MKSIAQNAVAALFDEDVTQVAQRECTAFDLFAREFSQRIVLYGAGGLGHKVLHGLRQNNIEPLAFCDNNPSLHGQLSEGLRVLSPGEAAAIYGKSAVFVAAMWKSQRNDRLIDRLNKLRALGCEKVTTIGSLFWKYHETFLPYFPVDLPHHMYSQLDNIIATAGVWGDERSTQEYFEQVRWRMEMNFDMADAAPEEIYFPEDIFHLDEGEIFVDCGAYDGDSIVPFVSRTSGRFERIYAFEPDASNFERLGAAIAGLPHGEKIVAKQACVGEKSEKISFAALGTDNSVAGQDGAAVDCVALDDVVERATYVKMDIEGYELFALEGMKKIIHDHKPKLAISAYHCQDHLWKIPQLIKSLRPDYKLYLRAHQRDFFDLVCYAV